MKTVLIILSMLAFAGAASAQPKKDTAQTMGRYDLLYRYNSSGIKDYFIPKRLKPAQPRDSVRIAPLYKKKGTIMPK